MRICIAQTKSEKGFIPKNIKIHLQFIERAVKLSANCIIFPELSITNYEPGLAKNLAFEVESEIFNPFQVLSDKHKIVIGFGVPTKSTNGINISLLIFQPNQARKTYSKQMLHTDELPYFVSGGKQGLLEVNETKIAFGICYESLQKEHLISAKDEGAEIYIASVAKPKGGIEKAYQHFPSMARELKMTILMANCVGFCDNFMSSGQSAVWNRNGVLLDQLDDHNPGFIIYDRAAEKVEKEQIII